MTKENKKEINKVSINNKNVIAETIYDYDTHKSTYLVKQKGGDKIEEKDGVEINNYIYKPFNLEHTLLNKGILTLPTGLESYKNRDALVKEIKNFIHSYVDISESFEIVSAYYILMTWVYDLFDNVGYLRVRGNPGNGKSRFLEVVNAISYKSTFFRVNPTESVIFRALDDTRGTMVIDEADYKYSGKTSNITKLLNNGFAKNSSTTRTKVKKDGGYELETFDIFGPKIIANRDLFQDDALESRCLSEYMGGKKVRKEVQVSLNYEFENKAKSLRNKLLKFRFTEIENIIPLNSNELDFDLNSRSKQIGSPLATLMKQDDLKYLELILKNTERNLETIRGNLFESDVVKILKDALEKKQESVSIKNLTTLVSANYENHEKISHRKIGSILSNLNIERVRSGENGNFVISILQNKLQIENLIKYYNV